MASPAERIRARESDIKIFIARLDKFLYRNLDNILGDLQTGSASGVEAAKVLSELQTALRRLGLNEELGRLQAIYATEIRQIRKSFNDLGTKGQVFSGTDEDVISTLISFDTNKTATLINGYVDNVQSVMMTKILAGEEPDFGEVHDKFGQALEYRLDAELNTSLAAFDRTLTVKKAQDLDIDLFLYAGPRDDKTREFCKLLLKEKPPIYSLAEIRKMDNDSGLDVLTYGGGYNCRHAWVPLTREKAKEEGYKE